MIFDPYAWLKALHVAAAITFVTGVLGVAVFPASAQPGHAETVRAIHRDARAGRKQEMLRREAQSREGEAGTLHGSIRC